MDATFHGRARMDQKHETTSRIHLSLSLKLSEESSADTVKVLREVAERALPR